MIISPKRPLSSRTFGLGALNKPDELGLAPRLSRHYRTWFLRPQEQRRAQVVLLLPKSLISLLIQRLSHAVTLVSDLKQQEWQEKARFNRKNPAAGPG